MSQANGAIRAADSAAAIDLLVPPDDAVDYACPEVFNLMGSNERAMQERQKDRDVVPFGITMGRRAVHAEADAVIGLGEILEELKGRAALPRVQVNLLSAANHDFSHTRMLNRRGVIVVADGAHVSDT